MAERPSTIAAVGEALSAGRDEIDRLQSGASADARRIAAKSAAGAQYEARRQLGELQRLSDEIEREVETLEAASARFAEAAASASATLVELSAATDFTPPPFSGGLQGAVQRKREEAQ
jgi:hypothetical protein